MIADDRHAWTARLVRAMPREYVPVDLGPLADAVASAWRCASAAYPEIAMSPGDWFAYVGARLRADDPAGELARRNVADLYVACACVRRVPRAHEVFERVVLAEVARKLASLRIAADQCAEVMQALRERMLVATAGECELANYDGRAPLALWLRVAAVQMGRRQVARERRISQLDDRRLDEISPGVADPALSYLKRHYSMQFRCAFADAVASLAVRDRNLLRHAILDELGLEQIAAIYHVHRATAARQLRRAREALIAATRSRLRELLGVSEPELESILRGAMTMSDLTLRQALAAGRGRAAQG